MKRPLVLVLSALVVTVINKAGIVIGFLGWHFSGAPNQLAVQVPLALAVSITGTVLWLVKFGRWHRLDLERDGMLLFLAVFPVGAALFVPIHYVVTGYLTAFSNITAGWIFTFMANIPAFALAAAFLRRRTVTAS